MLAAETSLVASTVEFMSVVWMEGTMAILAAVLCFTLTGGPAGQKGSRKRTCANAMLVDKFADAAKPRAGQGSKAKQQQTGKLSDSKASQDDGATGRLTKHMVVQAKEMRAYGKAGDLNSAVLAFDRLQQSNQHRNALVFNSLLDACVECGDMSKALTYFDQARELGMADTISFNTVIKGHLAQNEIKSAEELLGQLADAGLTPTQASYNGLVHAYARAKDRQSVWRLVQKMNSSGVKPNGITCSIVLKSVAASSSADLTRAMGMVELLEEPMDEVLFSSVVDACVRTGQLTLLSETLAKVQNRDGPRMTLSAPIFGLMIKAYGHANDVVRVKELWREMEKQQVQPSSITVGCVVEALVANRCVEDARQLVQGLWENEESRPLVNTVIFTTILKGFVLSKDLEKAMSVYEDMQARGFKPNTITFNTMINVLAQCGAMDRVPKLLQDMRDANMEPDLVTYSTIVKGFCSCGDLDRAFGILKDMKQDREFAPDEMLYNSLLDGCAKQQRLDDALKLLDEMKSFGIAPSNYTLSMLVKVMGRCRRLNEAFKLVETTSQEYGFAVNIQVYTCLAQACFNNRQAGRAVELHDRIVKDGVWVDEKAYAVWVRGCLQAGLVAQSARLARSGMDSRGLDEFLAKLGRQSKEAKALLAELTKIGGIGGGAASSSATRQPKQRVSPSNRSKGGSGVSSPVSGDSSSDKVAPPWRRSA